MKGGVPPLFHDVDETRKIPDTLEEDESSATTSSDPEKVKAKREAEAKKKDMKKDEDKDKPKKGGKTEKDFAKQASILVGRQNYDIRHQS